MIHQGCVAGFVFPVLQREAPPLVRPEKPCRICGHEVPKGRHKFCSEECRLAHKKRLQRKYRADGQDRKRRRACH